MGWNWILQAARSDERWRLGRRLLDRGLRPGATATYRPLLQARTYVFLHRLLVNPDQWEAHVNLSAEFLSSSHCVPEFCLAFRES